MSAMTRERLFIHGVTASELFAAALAELWMALLTASVAEVMKRAAEAVHGQLREGTPTRAALNQVAKKIADSKLGAKAGEVVQG